MPLSGESRLAVDGIRDAKILCPVFGSPVNAGQVTGHAQHGRRVTLVRGVGGALRWGDEWMSAPTRSPAGHHRCRARQGGEDRYVPVDSCTGLGPYALRTDGGSLVRRSRCPGGAAPRRVGDRRADRLGTNAKPASEAAAGLRQRGHCVIVRGRLDITVDGAAVLDLAGSAILLDLAVPVSTEVASTWIELFIQRENIALYPYIL